MSKIITGKDLKEMLRSAVNSILNEVKMINALNVFPVPDGDTGSNMSSTCIHAWEEIKYLNEKSASRIAERFSKGMLLGARGNSGVILSQIFKGFSIAFKGRTELNSLDWVYAFKKAKDFAYKSVIKPVEGTILTVIKEIYLGLNEKILPSDTVNKVFEQAVKIGKISVDKTPELLPILKEAGVVDSGGMGLLIAIRGMLLALQGQNVKIIDKKSLETPEEIQNKFSFLKTKEKFEEGEFGFCTEFVSILKNPDNFNSEKFQKAFEKLGTSIVVVKDGEILKAHIHTEKPGDVINFGQRFGKLIKIKSENMTIQANQSLELKVSGPEEDKKTKDKTLRFGVISVNSGSGIIKEAKRLGATFVIEGGQTMNPSASDFVEAIKEINSEYIIILPNNSNVVLAAQQAAQTVQKKKIIIIPSKTQIQGLIALSFFSQKNTLEDNKEEMQDAIESVITGQVTVAIRNANINGISIKKDEYIAMVDQKIIKSCKTPVTAAIEICKKSIDESTEIVTIYYGENTSETDADEVVTFIETQFEDVEVEIKNGGQPIYNFLISIE